MEKWFIYKDAYKLLPLLHSDRLVAMFSYAESSLDINNLPLSHDQAFLITFDVMSLK